MTSRNDRPLLITTVAAVGVLHTLVPDHWAPIVVLGRQQGWSVSRTARAGAIAGIGARDHNTCCSASFLWAVGASLAVRYAHLVSVVAAVALHRLRPVDRVFRMAGAARTRRTFARRGGPRRMHTTIVTTAGLRHVHWHEHARRQTRIPPPDSAAVMHSHEHTVAGRTALLLILGLVADGRGYPGVLRGLDVRRRSCS